MGRELATWHQGVVTKEYPANYRYRGKPYTHDAKFDGSSEIRGVNLTSQLEADGIWVALRPIPAPVGAQLEDGGRRLRQRVS